eukprot:CFRG0557T1
MEDASKFQSTEGLEPVLSPNVGRSHTRTASAQSLPPPTIIGADVVSPTIMGEGDSNMIVNSAAHIASAAGNGKKRHTRTLSSILITSPGYERLSSPLFPKGGDGDTVSLMSSGRNSVHFTLGCEAQMSLEQIADFEPLDSDLPDREGVLMKWTNYIGGWQERWVELRDGNISYYRSRDEIHSCRGSVDLEDAIVSTHEFDDLRLDVSLKDTTFYFRCPTKEDAEGWLDALEQTKACYKNTLITQNSGLSDNDDNNDNEFEGMDNVNIGHQPILRRRPSVSSLASVASFKIKAANEKLKELDAYSEAMSVMQKKVMAEVEREQGLSDNIKDSMTSFQTTTSSLLDTLDTAISLLYAFEDDMHLRLVRERDIRRKLRHQVRNLRREKQQWESERAGYNGEFDATVDETSGLTGSHDGGIFFDALESTGGDWSDNYTEPADADNDVSTEDTMRQSFEIQTKKRLENILAARSAESKEGKGVTWVTIRQTPTTSVYRQDIEVADDQINDFVQAVTVVNGVTAKELTNYFWDVNRRSEWEGVYEAHRVLDDLGDDTIVVNQSYTRLWPAAQRDCTYLSCRKRIEESDMYAVINYSVNHPDDHIPASFVRASADVGMVCETIIRPECTANALTDLTRRDIQTKIYYQAKISPGGWVPAAVVRETSKREYPKVLHQLAKGCSKAFSKDDENFDPSTVRKAFESRPPPNP